MNRPQLDENLFRCKKVIVFGTGTFSKILLNRQSKSIIDNNQLTWGSLFNNRVVYPPYKLEDENKNEILIVIASMYYKEIAT